MLATLEHVCQRQELFYQKDHAGFSVIATGRYPESSHRVSLGLTQSGEIGVFVEFSPCEKKEIRNVEGFCEELGKVIGSGASVGFNDLEGTFFLYHVVKPDRLGSYLAILARDCDILKPLCESVGRMGNWHCALYLAFASPLDVQRWHRA